MVDTFTVADNVYGIDLEWFDTESLAAYVIDAPNPTLIETGFANSADRLRDGLRAVNVSPEELVHAVVSHVHLDHAGGASALATDATDLTVYAHESLADHLVSPDQLIESSERAMGDAFTEIGAPTPLPREHLNPVADGSTIDTGDRVLEVIHAPGHSPDHIAIWDETNGVLFANEGIGHHYPKINRWTPPTTLPRFDVDAVRETIRSLSALDPDTLVLSHFGALDDPPRAFKDARACLERFNERIPQLYDEHNGDIDAIEATVRADLVAFEPTYAEGLAKFESAFHTRGFLKYHGLL